MNRTLIAAVAMLGLAACDDPSGAKRALEGQGLEVVKVGGWSMFGCGEGDTYSTKFKATRDGKTYTGVVCSGLVGKGSTVRFD
ncbi:MAG: hypothetical protein NXI16_01350 [Alphaproteobacteria bacterium]|nr:hypothetical protein [Alphaproteobacteria bacterium]